MKIAVFSDVHANLQAWRAVLLDIRRMEADTLVCLGDIIGYGPNPAEVLESIHENANHLVMGNHDAAACGKIDPALFNDTAAFMIAWTRERLNSSALRFLESLPLSIRSDYFRAAHGDVAKPGAFPYIFDAPDAAPSWSACEENLIFVGHTHDPRIFILGESGIPRQAPPQDFVMEPDRRYIVNVGSVGQPRQEDVCSTYCLLDTDEQAVFWRSIPFDIDAYQDAVTREGLPLKTVAFLKHDPRLKAVPAREQVCFASPKTKEQQAQVPVEVAELGTLKKRARIWKIAFHVLLWLLLIGILTGGYAVMRYRGRHVEYRHAATQPTSVAAYPVDHNLLPDRGILPGTTGIQDWDLMLGNRRAQQIHTEQEPPGAIRIHSSDAGAPVHLSSRPFDVEGGQRFCAEIWLRKSPDFQGQTAMVISLVQEKDGAEIPRDQFLVKEPNMERSGGWLMAKQTFTLPAGSRRMRLHVQNRFSGTLTLGEMSLTRKTP